MGNVHLGCVNIAGDDIVESVKATESSPFGCVDTGVGGKALGMANFGCVHNGGDNNVEHVKVVPRNDPMCGDLEAATATFVEHVKAVPSLVTPRAGQPQVTPHMFLNHELIVSARAGDEEAVKQALDRGAWTETRRPLVMMSTHDAGSSKMRGHKSGSTKPPDETQGMTPVMYAAQRGSPGCIRHLVAFGADVNAVEEDNWTALHFAAKECCLECCRELLTAKCDPNILNDDDLTAVQVAQRVDGAFAKSLEMLQWQWEGSKSNSLMQLSPDVQLVSY